MATGFAITGILLAIWSLWQIGSLAQVVAELEGDCDDLRLKLENQQEEKLTGKSSQTMWD